MEYASFAASGRQKNLRAAAKIASREASDIPWFTT